VSQGVKTIIYPVKDISLAKSLYIELLGVSPTFDQPYYVGFDIGDQHIGLDPNGHNKGLNGPVPYWHVHDIRETLKRLIDKGAQAVHEIESVGEGKLISTVKDTDGNLIGLLQPASVGAAS
jgi:predicted enzyme related to lactoylglutathione lyase